MYNLHHIGPPESEAIRVTVADTASGSSKPLADRFRNGLRYSENSRLLVDLLADKCQC